MCGIAGGISVNAAGIQSKVSKMIEELIYRGPDDKGFYIDNTAVLAHTRLAIRGIREGKQPTFNKKRDIICVTNGEIYNNNELVNCLNVKEKMLCDTDCIPFLYEEFSVDMFEKINGQFAIAIWDKRQSELILARDRFGQKPLYYRIIEGEIYFASEIAPLMHMEKCSEINGETLMDICTTWGPLREKTIYKDICAVNCGEAIVFKEGKVHKKIQYFHPRFCCDKHILKKDIAVSQLDILLKESIINHQASDVPIAYYLSGGLDSSLIVAMAAKYGNKKIDTFSISFARRSLDESLYQNIVADKFNTRHRCLVVTEEDIIDSFYECVKHIQMPILRLGVVPMYLLAKYVSESGYKVVLSGEGADELFGGYDIFKETKIRRFCEKDPRSLERGKMYSRINAYVDGYRNTNVAALTAFYGQVKSEMLFSSHLLRFKFGDYCKQFFSKELKKSLEKYSVVDEIKSTLSPEFGQYSEIEKAQYLEIVTFLENYLLSSQGDRVSMANGIECRYPFLDNRIVDFAFQLDDEEKICELNEKYILKEVAKRYLPKEIIDREKFPYRAIIDHRKLIMNEKIFFLLSKEKICEHKIFDENAVEKFLNRVLNKEKVSEKELMILVFICSTQILMEERNYG